MTTVVFEVDEFDRRTLAAARARIVIARHGVTGQPSVVWLAWEPSGHDVLAWDESYGLYAAHPDLRPGSVLCAVARVQRALDRAVYVFLGDAFAAPCLEPHILASHYDVRNGSRFAIACGLLQAAFINGMAVYSPLHAIVLPPGLTADFIAPTATRLWMQSGIESGSVAAPFAEATTIVLEARQRMYRFRYDGRLARFVRVADPSRGRARTPPS